MSFWNPWGLTPESALYLVNLWNPRPVGSLRFYLCHQFCLPTSFMSLLLLGLRLRGVPSSKKALWGMTQGVLPVRPYGVWAVHILWKQGCDQSVMPFLFLCVCFLASLLYFVMITRHSKWDLGVWRVCCGTLVPKGFQLDLRKTCSWLTFHLCQFLLKIEEHVAKEFSRGPQQPKTSLHNIRTKSIPWSLLNASKEIWKRKMTKLSFEFRREGVWHGIPLAWGYIRFQFGEELPCRPPESKVCVRYWTLCKKKLSQWICPTLPNIKHQQNTSTKREHGHVWYRNPAGGLTWNFILPNWHLDELGPQKQN